MIIRLDEEWSTYKKLLFLKAMSGGGANEYEITGNPVSFATNLARPLSGFTIPFLPVQSGTGDPSPSNVRPISGWTGVTAWRTRKNLFDPANPLTVGTRAWKVDANGYIMYKGITDGRQYIYENCQYFLYLKAGTYYIFGESTDTPITGSTFKVILPDNTNVKTVGITNISIVKTSFTLSADSEVGILVKIINEDAPYQHNYRFVLSMEEADAYTPYTGQSYPITFPALGKNLLPTQETIRSGNTTYIGGSDYWIPLKAGTYTMFEGGTSAYLYWRKKGTTENNIIHTSASHSGSFTLEEDSYVRFWYYAASNDATYSDIMLNAGNTALPYEPYTTTVYGGTLDAVNGVLTVEYKFITENGTGQWGEVSTGGDRWYIGDITTDAETLDTTGACNIGKLVNAFTQTGIVVQSNGRINLCGDLHNAFNDVAELKTFLSENPLQLVYKLATPIEIQLDPIAVQTLLGDNTIWTDTNGENTIRYKKKG